MAERANLESRGGLRPSRWALGAARTFDEGRSEAIY